MLPAEQDREAGADAGSDKRCDEDNRNEPGVHRCRSFQLHTAQSLCLTRAAYGLHVSRRLRPRVPRLEDIAGAHLVYCHSTEATLWLHKRTPTPELSARSQMQSGTLSAARRALGSNPDGQVLASALDGVPPRRCHQADRRPASATRPIAGPLRPPRVGRLAEQRPLRVRSTEGLDQRQRELDPKIPTDRAEGGPPRDTVNG